MDSLKDIFEGIIQPQLGTFSEDHARYVLTLDFSPEQHARYEELSKKANGGTFTADEAAQLDKLLAVNAILTVLQAKARVSLIKHTTAA